MTGIKKTLRQELLEAREKILRQIDICQNNPPSNFWAANAGGVPPATPVPDLMAKLKEIDNALENLRDGV